MHATIPSATAIPVHQLAALRLAPAVSGTLAAMPPCDLGIGMTPVSPGAGGGVFVRFGVGIGLTGDGTSGPEPMGSW